MELLIGLGLLALTYFAFNSLKPVGTVVHPLMRREILGACVALGLVATLTIGSAFLISGVVKFF